MDKKMKLAAIVSLLSGRLSPMMLMGRGRKGSQRKVGTHFGLPDSGFFSPFFLFRVLPFLGFPPLLYYSHVRGSNET